MKGGLTCGNDVVDNQYRLSGLDSVLLDVKVIPAVLLFKSGLSRRSRQLASFPNRRESDAQAKGETGTKEEAASVEAHDDIGNAATIGGDDLEFEGSNELFVPGVVGEERKDIDKVDARAIEGFQSRQHDIRNSHKCCQCGGELGGR